MKQEQILCFKKSLLYELGDFHGINFNIPNYFPVITAPENTFYRDRAEAEQDETCLQLIPYVLITNPKDMTILRYQRGKSGGENRLHGLYSVGIGGHISREDTVDPAQSIGYQAGMARELQEEAGIVFTPGYAPPAVAMLMDHTTRVGRVHFGVVHMLLAEDDLYIRKCADLIEPEFVEVGDAFDGRMYYESWSQICLMNFTQLSLTAARMETDKEFDATDSL